MNIGMNAFVNGGADEALLKSLAEDERYQGNEELEKALKKEGLVQVQTQVQGKHGTYTRMQWKRASDVKSTDHVVGQQKPSAAGEGQSKSSVSKFENIQVNQTTEPATVTFEFKGKRYKAQEGKNLTFHVQSTSGERQKISGKLKATDGGYVRVGAYPLEGMNNVLDVSAKEAGASSEDVESTIKADGLKDCSVSEDGVRVGNDFYWADHEEPDQYYKGSWEGAEAGDDSDIDDEHPVSAESVMAAYKQHKAGK